MLQWSLAVYPQTAKACRLKTEKRQGGPSLKIRRRRKSKLLFYDDLPIFVPLSNTTKTKEAF
ncbi:Uncharacterised protein [Streptococcus criceti]|nr:Uncharacterised protein [Streptococcus criceti]